MKEVMHVKDEKTLELLSDPFVMDILNIIEGKKMSKEDINNELREDVKMISSYINNMEQAGLLIKEGEHYRVSARSIDARGTLMKASAETAMNWISGFINHMENNIGEQFKNLEELKKSDEEAVYCLMKSYRLSHSQMYLTEEEIKELNEMLNNFIKSKRIEDREDKDKYRKCHFYNFFYPET